jgi:multiple sugar transport system permease protein
MKKKTMLEIITYALLISGSVLYLLPLYWLIRSSLMEMSQIFIMPPVWFPDPVKISNYYEAFTIIPFGRYFLNTVLIVSLSITGVVPQVRYAHSVLRA